MELYHVLNRGVEKRRIFLDTQDHRRFVQGLELFNDKKPAENSEYFFSRRTESVEHIDLRGRYSKTKRRVNKESLVDVHGWCLMKNHYHLLLSEKVEKGISKFLMKLNVGYAKYFNEKYKRQGTLFQGRSKKIRIDSEAHFLHILHYIHLNPLDFQRDTSCWREGHVDSAKKALACLEEYRWSSYADYCGRKNFPALLTTELFGDVFGDYRKVVTTYIKELELDTIKDFLLE